RPTHILLLLLVISQIVSAYYIFKNREYIIDDSERFVSYAINSTEEKRYSHPIIDVTENRVYIPEARIYLPLNETTRHLRYEYNDSFDDARLYLSMRGVVGHQRETESPFCDKMISFSKEKKEASGFVSEIKTTKDGFRYIYRHPKCEIYYGTVDDDLANAAKEIKNY